MNTTKKALKRELILKAASMIVHEEGVEKLTLEAVAKKAGISKGGLLYHFPNKDELILGMVEQLSTSFVSEFNERAENDMHSKGRWTRAYMNTSFCGDRNASDLYTALSAAQFTNPHMLKLLQDEYENIQNKIENDELDPVRSTIVRLAIDGLWFAEMFGLAPPNEEMRQKMMGELKTYIKEGE
ncbi:TetR/AcrR family transcriptional regulator [Paenibacillus sp. MZ03-122A]|uniref:TetR/AcrR family transcriptional regulator n=1 Tax=Paenibacillus sp. MZ03-122A TaxID=2962033 RepID=UPI0020B7D6F7|nr:TetR/AcrR family transcriptional regulator [Paenibacillus sp. MZ03-122A]MCP3777647.1 TetR/AcrR family transcriptional regulator [Paenibacillus sp. MZ03-122A]